MPIIQSSPPTFRCDACGNVRPAFNGGCGIYARPTWNDNATLCADCVQASERMEMAKRHVADSSVSTDRTGGGHPNTWPAENGGAWTRIKVMTGAVAGQEGWQLVDAEGKLVGLFDDDGDNLNQGNAVWKETKSAQGPGWI